MAEYEYYDLPMDMINRVFAGSVEPIDKNKVTNAIDENLSTIWHTSWKGCKESDRYITLVMENPVMLNALRYYPRQGSGNGSNNGRVRQYRVSVSMDGTNYKTVASGSWADNAQRKTAYLNTPTEARYIRLEGVSTYGDGGADKFMSAAELVVNAAELD